jgi:hypothetical protein
VRSPDHNRQRIARQRTRRRRIKTRGAAPFADLGIPKAETAMGVFIAQEFERVGCKIGNHQDAVRPQHAGGFGNRRCRPVGIVQDLMDHDRVKRRVRQSQLIHVVAADPAICDPGTFEIDPRYRKHLARLVDPERALDPGRQDFEHPPRSGANVEQIARVGGVDDVDQRSLDLALVDI